MPRTTVSKMLRVRQAIRAAKVAAAICGRSGTMVGAPTAKNNGGAMIAAITAGGTQRRACAGVIPALLAAAPQTMPKRMMLMLIGAKARTPAINSTRVLGTCGMGHFCE